MPEAEAYLRAVPQGAAFFMVGQGTCRRSSCGDRQAAAAELIIPARFFLRSYR
ncbi:hypothetical protein DESPIG_00662 [Desulfovibrio piger ATCC 29098]|uniref:Uncharacterized protein n=1 Tax=Desulfovibrio piger ATCC 29098 TaxID=411464 RepID=B6WRH1_9BACT|nr:hypothetical protein DESPIG_00662 [Desulfovibrio piger ATCC 29098]